MEILKLEIDMKKLFKIAIALLVLTLAACLPTVAGASAPKKAHTVLFYDRGDLVGEYEVPDGEVLDACPSPAREGYKLVGWRFGDTDGAPFDLGTPVVSDLELHAVYELLPPSFDISSLELVYDGTAHTLAFSSVSHPLLDGGILSYEWYKDGDPIAAYGSSIAVKNVSDSGAYTCRLVLSVGGDVAEVTTPAVNVAIAKREIALPTLDKVYYTGDSQLAPIYDNGYYTVERMPATHAGTYPVTLTLTDSDNFSFPGTDKPTATVDFIILPAENFWVVSPQVSDVYESFSPDAVGMSRFGTPTFLYSTDGVTYSPAIPTAPGEYLMRAEVKENENYSALVSEPIRFSILPEEVVGISVITPADKMSYRAFESFDPHGLAVGVTYNSGRHETVEAESLTVSYQQGDSFRYRDSGVIISYSGASVLLRTTVTRADYDLSGITFADSSTIFCGKIITPTFEGRLPVGVDGIQLAVTISGGGIDVGDHTVTLSFSTDSDNYNCPKPITATLTILPYEATVTWSNLSFVYDGTAKQPEAYYLDVHGRKVSLSPVGAHSFAGKYVANVSSPDVNYTFKNPSVEYEILKADYDMSGAVWQGGGEVYDGAEKCVTLGGLPTGVRVIGYVNSTATEAGEYTATAALDYDSANYNPPIAPAFTWSILKAEYKIDSFTFSDISAVYNGAPHYPILTGEMPLGIDGIPLGYTYTSSATHVSDGRVAVEIVFVTESRNYNVPESLVRYVEILPMDITVLWENVEFRYTGAAVSPSATAKECEITVFGGGINAGEYTARAVCSDPDYRVSNDTCSYVILRAENSWLAPLSVRDVFLGRQPDPTAEAKAGDIEFLYYSDIECKYPLDLTPSQVGKYYVVAYSWGDENHEPITSAPVAFEIIAIIPVSLSVTLSDTTFFALDPVTFTAHLINNDGSTTPLDQSAVAVIYQTADSLRFGDANVAFSYGGLDTVAPVTVIRRDYDLSGVAWSDTSFVYDGNLHSVMLLGLPEGLAVSEYLGNGFTLAGQYTVTAVLDYDAHNYNPPVIPPHTVTVEKQILPLPIVSTAEYDGSTHTATLAHSPLYTVSPLPIASSSGAYPITLTLTDPDNYTFGTAATSTVFFVIKPRAITVTVSDYDLYLFERDIFPEYEITAGALVGADTLTPSYRVSDGLIYADFDAENYNITVIPGNLNRHRTLSQRATSLLLFVILIILALVLILIAILTNRRRIVSACRAYLSRINRESDKPDDPPEPEPTPDEPTPDASEDTPVPPDNTAEIASIVDAEYADTAITNSLARDLIRHDEDVVTNGRRRGIVNVDTLSRSFAAGERVDVNTLKSRSLIPYDTAYIKVLARGMIDKPLYVYANDFSLSAVKMIALTGGRAVKVNTIVK